MAQLPAHARQMIIIDACYSGAFLDELKAEGRVVITSTNAESQAWNPRLDNFSQRFMTAQLQGMDVFAGFTKAKLLIDNRDSIFGNQTPWLDDNADGISDTRDGNLASGVWLGRPVIAAPSLPEIQEIHPRLEVNTKDTKGALLWVKLNQVPERIRSVRAGLVEYTGADGINYNENTDFSRYEVKLNYNPDSQRYEALYKNFPKAGLWKIAYQAWDLEGLWSEISIGEVEVLPEIETNMKTYPEIQEVHPRLEVDAESKNSALVWVIVNQDPENISSVRASFVEEMGFTSHEMELNYNPDLQRYETLYENFPQSGLWKINYQAWNLEGQSSEIAIGEVSIFFKKPVYRIYSEEMGNHFYTENEVEYANRQDTIWSRPEGVKFQVPEAIPGITTPVCRFKKPDSGVYFYTIKKSECEGLRYKLPGYSSEWTYEKDAFHAYLPGQQPADALPVYRFYRYNPLSGRELSHFFTVSATERDGLMNCDGDNAARCAADGIQDSLPDKSNVEFRYEGIAWYMYGS